MFNLSATAIGIVLCRYGAVATHSLVPTVCMDEPGQQINAKRHVNHHPLTPSITPPGCWPSITHFVFLLPTAGLPAGAARLPGREVTTRGRPNVTTGTEEAPFSCCRTHSFIHSFLPCTKRIKHVDFSLFFYECNNGSHFLIKVSLNVEFCVFLCPLKCKHILPLTVFTFVKDKLQLF